MGSYRGAAAICATTPKTVGRVIERHEAGSVVPQRKPRQRNYEPGRWPSDREPRRARHPHHPRDDFPSGPRRTTGRRGEAVETCHRYLTGHLDQLHHDTALASGWPIVTGAVEDACRHLNADRLDITGARWGLAGAEAVLRLRTVVSNCDLEAYWRFHASREHQRLYPTADQDEYELMA